MRLAFVRKAEDADIALQHVNAAFRAGVRDKHPEIYSDLLKIYGDAMAEALPSRQPGYMARLAKGLPDAVERAIAFLEADPWCDCSGYEKAGVIRHIKRAPLTEVQRLDLQAVILKLVDHHYRTEFKHYGRLARRVQDPAFVASLVARTEGEDRHVARRAGWILRSLDVRRADGRIWGDDD